MRKGLRACRGPAARLAALSWVAGCRERWARLKVQVTGGEDKVLQWGDREAALRGRALPGAAGGRPGPAFTLSDREDSEFGAKWIRLEALPGKP